MSAQLSEWHMPPRWRLPLALLNGMLALIFLSAALAAIQHGILFRALGFAGSAGIALLVSASFIPALRVRTPAAKRPIADRLVFWACYGLIMLGGLINVYAAAFSAK